MLNYLDCTLRDGGYYNNWNFDIDFVKSYLNAINNTIIQYVEVGLKDVGSVNLGNITDDLLKELKNDNPNLKVGTMSFVKDDVKTLYTDPSSQDFVRIGAKLHEIHTGLDKTRYLKDLGYFVCLNLTHLTPLDSNSITATFQTLASRSNDFDVLYIADTYGTMNPYVISYFNSLKTTHLGKDKPIGFHGHNNNRMALTNTHNAIQDGYSWVDGTFMGFGRGAGNTEMERLIKSVDIYKISLMFYNLYKTYNWGPNVCYSYASEYNIHPTYVQNLLQTESDPDRLFLVLNELKDHPERLLFSDKLLNNLKGKT